MALVTNVLILLSYIAGTGAAVDCECNVSYNPICCPGDINFRSRCAARCAGVDPDTCNPKKCRPKVSPGIKLPSTSESPILAPDDCPQPEVHCMVDPCVHTGCSFVPSHTCHYHSCFGFVDILGVSVGPCAPLFISKQTGEAVANRCPVMDSFEEDMQD
eukprot:TRINITY_DN3318_c0_g2_i1.p4 TRINITY_DN3318_c0_g2~~TRINITY_DN3318_c0_g2_i1.p4  ORF type:complete len:186 (-),score=7.84 TRINITY_DN3318_c0_g2_i1:991-1467(-)